MGIKHEDQGFSKNPVIKLLISSNNTFHYSNDNRTIELDKLQFGAPFHFIEQIPALSPGEKDLPLTLTVLSPWQHPTRILWGNLLASIICVSVFLLVSIKLFKRIFKYPG